jgi:hypothetical protein
MPNDFTRQGENSATQWVKVRGHQAIKHIILLFVETPRKCITAVINLRGLSTDNKTIVL